MDRLTIRPATVGEFATAVDWAAAEGWNPGIGDLEAFHDIDPDGFLMGFEDGEPVSSISVVRYDERFGFLGFYIVRADRRGRGAGRNCARFHELPECRHFQNRKRQTG